MKTFFASLGGALIGAILGVVLLVFLGIGLVQMGVENAFSSAKTAGSGGDADAILLSLDLRDDYNDQAVTTGPETLLNTPVGFIDVLTRLDAARQDDRVKGVFIRSGEYGFGSARAEELRDALHNLKTSGKFVITHSQGIYDGGPSAYRAVSASDEIWIQPGADLIASGLSFETLFLKGMLDKLSITPEFIGLYEYKNAVNTFEEEAYTAPHREAMTALANSIWTHSLKDIAADRDLSVEETRQALEASPLGAEELIAYRLADTLGWPEEAEDAALSKAGEEAVMVNIDDYIPPSVPFGAPVVAIIGGEGAVVTNAAGGSLIRAGNEFASDTIAAALLEAGKDDAVKALVFRVDSPGGSPTASDQILRAVQRVQSEYNKPVIISMASVAASGGYYVSAGADWIVANRTTITGSIGILGGKFAIADGLARLGVNADTINVGGPFTGAFTSTQAFSDTQRDQFRAFLERGYDRFISIVADGRDMTSQQVHQVARGRVWSGEDALNKGLVDQLGGINVAIAKAKEMAEIDADTQVRLVQYPKRNMGLPFLMGSASAAELNAVGQLANALQNPQLQAMLQEIEAARGARIQARMPYINER